MHSVRRCSPLNHEYVDKAEANHTLGGPVGIQAGNGPKPEYPISERVELERLAWPRFVGAEMVRSLGQRTNNQAEGRWKCPIPYLSIN